MKRILAALAMAAMSASMSAQQDNWRVIAVEKLPNLPVAIANNAVALLPLGQGLEIYSFLGLESGKTWADTSRRVLRYRAGADVVQGEWAELAPVPGEVGRLAASAVVAGGEVYLFGGYTVAEDGEESSTPEVYRLNREAGQMERFTVMPVPVEDAVLGVHQDRWIYLVSGWHDLGNVNLVQVLDTRTGEWVQATPYPGRPVFGHNGGMANGTLVVCDGVAIENPPPPDPRRFVMSDECWSGAIHGQNHRRIDWRRIDPLPGPPRYRMAAGDDGGGRIWFAGGATNPYNYDGTGYDGNPSEPGRDVFSFDVASGRWQSHGALQIASMDHRGLLHHDGWFYIVGGMRNAQAVSPGVFRFRP